MALNVVLLPGDVVPPDSFAVNEGKSKSLTLGPGLQYQPPATISASTTGNLAVDQRRRAAWLENNGAGRYVPAVGDLVVATVHHSSADFYHVALTSYTPHALLPQLSFEGASRKSRPMLQGGSVVYTRVCLANKHMDAEVECVHPSTGKSDGLGELKGGMVFDISLGLARRMMMGKARQDGGFALLEELADKGLHFEIAVGRNGQLWVRSDSVKTTLIVGNAVQATDAGNLDVPQQVKLAKDVMRHQ